LQSTRLRSFLTLALFPLLISGIAAGCGGGGASPVDAGDAGATTVTVTVDPTTTHQTMVGFGAAVAYYDSAAMMNAMSAQLYQTLFADLGIQILRVGNWYNNNNDNNAGFNQTAAFVASVHQMGFSPILLMSSWNPPQSLKSNGQLRNGGTLTKTSSGGYDYASFATWWAQSLTAFQTATGGIVPDYISIQNEPDFTTNNEGTCLFDPTEDATNAGYGQALDAVKSAIAGTAGLPAPKLIGPENDSLSKNELARYTEGIAAAGYADDLDVVAHHDYGSGTDALPSSFTSNLALAAAAAGSKTIWESEYAPNNQNTFNTASLIQASVTIEGVSAYLYWDLYWPAPSSSTSPPSGLVSTSSTGYTINQDYYAVQHFAKEIAPGWTRVDATSTDTIVSESAFLSPDGTQLTLVLINTDLSSDHQVVIDTGTFAWTTSSVYRSSGTTERFAAIGPLDAASSFDMPSQSIATVTLGP
jgi:glucuronoarabinoxylan endo-1,4-beta-xylanase